MATTELADPLGIKAAVNPSKGWEPSSSRLDIAIVRGRRIDFGPGEHIDWVCRIDMRVRLSDMQPSTPFGDEVPMPCAVSIDVDKA